MAPGAGSGPKVDKEKGRKGGSEVGPRSAAPTVSPFKKGVCTPMGMHRFHSALRDCRGLGY